MRAAAIIIHGDQIALIERFREGNHYFVFPGGSTEPGEAPQDAVVREVLEETGLHVTVDRLIAIVRYRDMEQHYYLVNIQGGVFGSGMGMEVQGLTPAEDGRYIPVWKSVSELSRLDGWPRPLFDLVSRFLDTGIPEQVAVLEDLGGISAREIDRCDEPGWQCNRT